MKMNILSVQLNRSFDGKCSASAISGALAAPDRSRSPMSH